MTSDLPKVVFIGGASRSGSTLLDRILGEIPDVLSTGELRRIWDRGLQADHLCGCGSPFSKCDFWQSVLSTAYEGEELDAGAMRRRRARIERPRNVPRLLFRGLRNRSFEHALSDYAAAMRPLYGALAEISGKSTIVDSSKAPLHGMALMNLVDFDVRVIHLVRDSRAVAFSQQRQRVKPDVHDNEVLMKRLAPSRAARKWLSSNAQVGLIRFRDSEKYLRIRYEDLVRDPSAVVEHIGRFLGLSPASPPSLDGRSISFGVGHTVSGNPMRFAKGAVPIKMDSEWKRSMNARDRRLVTSLTAPLLLGYGYPMGRSMRSE